jgi:hypothetical protein
MPIKLGARVLITAIISGVLDVFFPPDPDS